MPKNPFDPEAHEISADIPMLVGYTREDSGIRDLSGPELTADGLIKLWLNANRSKKGVMHTPYIQDTWHDLKINLTSAFWWCNLHKQITN